MAVRQSGISVTLKEVGPLGAQGAGLTRLLASHISVLLTMRKSPFECRRLSEEVGHRALDDEEVAI